MCSRTSASSRRRRRSRPCDWLAPMTIRSLVTSRPRHSSGSPIRSSSTGSASASRPMRSSASSAWAATATSRSPECRACTGRLPSTRSGRVRATSSAWMSCARWPRRRARWTRSSPRSRRPRAMHALIPTSRAFAPTSPTGPTSSSRARSLVERMALALQALAPAALRRSGRRRRLLLKPPRRRPRERIRHPAERHRLHSHHRASPCSAVTGHWGGMSVYRYGRSKHRAPGMEGWAALVVERRCRPTTAAQRPRETKVSATPTESAAARPR